MQILPLGAGEHLGCAELPESVGRRGPSCNVFGHIHGGAGTFNSGATHFVNAAYLNEQFKPLKHAGRIRIIDVECVKVIWPALSDESG